MKYKIGDIVTSKIQVIEWACGDHPAFLLCNEAQKLKVVAIYPAIDFPVYGKDSYGVTCVDDKNGEFYIDEDELE